MICPKCGSENLQPLTETTTKDDYKGYGCCKGLIGYIFLGPIGWLCGLCDMGKGRSTTTTRVYWKCGSCGARFR